ncbi:MAG: methyltransferase domain-containing protein [Kiritimatiellae bacterium]|jgi:predicted nicotinamide N-methyase|nr:methyltransferase domain-containing protein [Kiritimatiellia bacterium]
MKTDPVSPQIKKTITAGELTLTIETPPDLDKLLETAAQESPHSVDAIPYYSILWPSAIALAKHLSENCALLKGARVIELGCGLGLPSILCARMGAEVIATDFHPGNEQWLQHNAALNQATLNYQQLDWNTFVAADPDLPIPPVSLIIGSDLIYERKHIAALVCAINALCSPGGNVIIADPGRDHLQLFASTMKKAGWDHTLEIRDDIFIMHFQRPL